MKNFTQYFIILFLLFGTSCTSYKHLSVREIGSHRDVESIIKKFAEKYKNNNEKRIFQKSAAYFLVHLKNIYGLSKWETFKKKLANNTNSLEHNIISIYGKTIYQIGGDLHSNLDYPYETRTKLNFLKTQYVRVYMQDETSLQDKLVHAVLIVKSIDKNSIAIPRTETGRYEKAEKLYLYKKI